MDALPDRILQMEDFFMGLKQELQNLSIERLKQVSDDLNARLDSLPREEFEAEAIAHIEAYPALNYLVEIVSDQAFDDGEEIAVVVGRGTGASHALIVLATLADIEDLPQL